jgi:hypothetical protein
MRELGGHGDGVGVEETRLAVEIRILRLGMFIFHVAKPP